jgi:GDP-6-deoxy-D-talose 4-dehydrogenase
MRDTAIQTFKHGRDMSRKVLITGLSGFTGRHLGYELERFGYTVSGLSTVAQSDLPWPCHQCDLLDRAALSASLAQLRPDIVIHLAAIAFVADGDVRRVYETNIMGTRNLLDTLASSGTEPHAVLLASSANIYGNAVQETLDEMTPPAPANDYAISKLAMEYMASLWTDKLPITITRPFNYTGVGQNSAFLLPKIVDHFARKSPTLELGNLDVVRDFSDVRTVADAYRRIAEHGFRGQVFNICSGTGFALRDVIDIMVELTGHRPEIRVNPAFVRKSEVHRLVGDGARLRHAIGQPKSIPLRETLSWMLEHAQ